MLIVLVNNFTEMNDVFVNYENCCNYKEIICAIKGLKNVNG